VIHDHFSKQAATYKKFRPSYPLALYQWLIGETRAQERAWDCATGNGQVAKDLTPFFDRVVASDISETQLAQAEPHPRIEYIKAPGESCPSLESKSVDLVVVAQAFHWLDGPKFFAEAKRVLKPQGILAIWNYDWAEIDAEIDRVLNRFGKDLLKNYWPEEIKRRAKPADIQDAGFEILKAPNFHLEVLWDYFQLRGYFDSWSATQIYKDKHHSDPFLQIEEELKNIWKNLEKKKQVRWPLYLSVARLKA